MTRELDRREALAYRILAQDLHGGASPAELSVLTVGLQDSPAGSAVLGLRQRAGDGGLDRPEFALALTVRGSPHLHRRADLPLIRAALRPRDNDMLRAYLGGYGDELIASGADGPALLETVASEMRAAFPRSVATKGELSGAVSPRLPKIARPWCEGCGVDHVADGLFRLATLYAGVELEPHGGRRLRFRLAADEPTVADDDWAATELLRAHLQLAGPATLGDLVMWLDTRSVTAPPDWLKPNFDELADELEEVRVQGVKATLWVHAEALASMSGAPEPPPALLLPPRDAYLLGNRSFLVPERAVAKAVWRPVGSPGVVVVAGEVAGVWRSRQSGRTLRLSVTAYTKLTAKQRAAVEEQGDVVAAARGHDGKTEVVWED
jgi:Winged helix DNA-binding domain